MIDIVIKSNLKKMPQSIPKENPIIKDRFNGLWMDANLSEMRPAYLEPIAVMMKMIK